MTSDELIKLFESKGWSFKPDHLSPHRLDIGATSFKSPRLRDWCSLEGELTEKRLVEAEIDCVLNQVGHQLDYASRVLKDEVLDGFRILLQRGLTPPYRLSPTIDMTFDEFKPL